MSASEGRTNEVKTQPSLFHHLLHSAHSLPEVMVRKKNSRIEENWDWWKEEWQHILITLLPPGFLSLIFYLSFFLSFLCWWLETWRDRLGLEKDRETKRKSRRWWSLLHGLLVLLVCADVLIGLFALLAPLALLVFVPPVAVALLAVVPPSAAAANGRRRMKACKGQRR